MLSFPRGTVMVSLSFSSRKILEAVGKEKRPKLLPYLDRKKRFFQEPLGNPRVEWPMRHKIRCIKPIGEMSQWMLKLLQE